MKQARQPPTAGHAPDAERRKRLGQYFTGVGLGRILAAPQGSEDGAASVRAGGAVDAAAAVAEPPPPPSAICFLASVRSRSSLRR